MITFNFVEWANFLSNGATPTRINITDHSTNLIRGHNGAGKTTFMDALLYCLFNKPLRKVNLPQLVNSVNKKKMIAIVNFTTRGVRYEVHRGQKPKVFKILREVDGVMVEMDSTNDLQKTLENEILRTNYKTFTQVVVMASMNYTNFMSLSPADRRVVVNQMLDLETLTIMSKLLAERAKEVKGRQMTTDGKYSNISTRIESQQRLLNDAAKSSDDLIGVLDNQISSVDDDVANLNGRLDILRDSNNKHQSAKPDVDVIGINDQLSKLNDMVNANRSNAIKAKTNHENDVRTATFYVNHNHCDRCEQPIDAKFKNDTLLKLKAECESNKQIIDVSGINIDNANSDIENLRKTLNVIDEWTRNGTLLINQAKDIQNQIRNCASKKTNLLNERQSLLNKDTSKVNDYQTELNQLNDEMTKLIEVRAEISEDIELCGLCSQMLSDNGLKAKIIKEYLPIFNTTINHYLDAMGAQYSFVLDEQFNETILSRYRDNFSYGSFSNGEAGRINLSILFTFRKIASLKNTVATNLLIMDEVLDTSMDKDGIEDLMKIIGSLDRTNIFVVSHREEIVDLFDNVITVKKHGNFATYEGN